MVLSEKHSSTQACEPEGVIRMIKIIKFSNKE